ncbi:MAG: bifunctional glutamate N-acetyltransferase/amino-acid acetyltransferase ArgJ [Candidatus Omnitrophota bacterium]
MQKYPLPKGFLANGVHCEVKRKRKDLAVLYSEDPCDVSALFTRNKVKAAPVIVAQKQLKKIEQIRAVVINSGNANCMTGQRGIYDTLNMAKKAAELLNVKPDEIVVSSTGIIGKFMPMEKILAGMDPLVFGISRHGLFSAVEGIMTTDRFRKIVTRTFKSGGKEITMTGIAKGAGMIKPDMATMLCYIMTDAKMSKGAIKKALKKSTDISFNAITVDGDMSTNDTVMLLANGRAGNRIIRSRGKDFEVFQKNLNDICKELAVMIVRDGEGASKVIMVEVKGAKTNSDAKKIAEAVADSLLVKCAVLGGDPNWGRIASSAGASGANFDLEKMEIILDGVTFFKNNKTVPHLAEKQVSVFKGEDVSIVINLHDGNKSAACYSCDISKKYITFNSFYTT